MSEIVQFDVSGQTVPVVINLNRRAKRLQFRLDPQTGNVKLTLPPGISRDRGLRFVADKADWLLSRRAKILASQITLDAGVQFPVAGRMLTLQFGNRPKLGSDFIVVREKSPSSDLANLLKTRARASLTPLAHKKAEVLGIPISRLIFRDTKSRWGSCTSTGVISLNWRIVAAEGLIQDYLVAHEVAHLKHPHHRSSFWAQCAQLMDKPNLMDKARATLKSVGPNLLALPLT